MGARQREEGTLGYPQKYTNSYLQWKALCRHIHSRGRYSIWSREKIQVIGPEKIKHSLLELSNPCQTSATPPLQQPQASRPASRKTSHPASKARNNPTNNQTKQTNKQNKKTNNSIMQRIMLPRLQAHALFHQAMNTAGVPKAKLFAASAEGAEFPGAEGAVAGRSAWVGTRQGQQSQDPCHECSIWVRILSWDPCGAHHSGSDLCRTNHFWSGLNLMKQRGNLD